MLPISIFSKRSAKACLSIARKMSRKMSVDHRDIIIQNIQDKGVITLNRPKVLNSLSLSMLRKLYSVLKDWETKKTLVIMKGAGEKAFCAGGDLRGGREAVLRGENIVEAFFKHEYTINGIIGAYRIPYIALIDGIVMGGGVGLSIHGRYRVATERTLFAMPETQIGHFPDVGGSYFLPRLTGRLGWFLGLTGHRLKGSDVVKAGLATHYCESKYIKELEDALLRCSNDQDIKATLNKFNKNDNSEFSLTPVMEKINSCFAARSIEEILSNLEKDGSEWANNTIHVLHKMSPTSLKVALKELELGRHLTLQECLKMEYRIALHCLENKDFYEGVRALLVDKDKNPKWNPSTILEVSEKMVESYFSKVPRELELQNMTC